MLGVRLVKHSEPIVLIGIPEAKMKAVAEGYAGLDLVAEARVRAPAHAPVSIDRASLAFTVLSEGRMLTARGCQGG